MHPYNNDSPCMYCEVYLYKLNSNFRAFHTDLEKKSKDHCSFIFLNIIILNCLILRHLSFLNIHFINFHEKSIKMSCIWNIIAQRKYSESKRDVCNTRHVYFSESTES